MKKKATNNKTINITQVKSTIGRNKIQKKNLISLGLKKINHLIKIEKGWLNA